jgi:3-hydroxyacyl-[acyl-carrier-protein] dehydratase
MRFHLIDRVDGYEPGKWVRGRKLTSYSEDFWEEIDGSYTMPPPLILESLCQAGTWLIITTTERRKRAALLSIGSVSFLGEVHPGDILEIDGTVESMSEEMAVLSGRAGVNGETVMEATDIMCTLIDADTLDDLETTRRMQELIMFAGVQG